MFSRLRQDGPIEVHPSAWFQYAQLADGAMYLHWRRLFEFVVSADGCRVTCRPLNGASREAFQTYLLGQVLSFALLKQGVEPFHATTVVVNGESIAFVGDCGYGKSSLGAAFLQAGYRLLTDDLLVLKAERRGFLAYPGPPRIKLLPKVARSLLGNRINGTPMNSLTSKLVIPLERQQACGTPVPLRAIYVLVPPAPASQRARVSIRRLSRRRAFLELVRNTFNTVITEPERLKRQFLHARAVACSVPVKQLSYPRKLGLLPFVREAILADLAQGIE